MAFWISLVHESYTYFFMPNLFLGYAYEPFSFLKNLRSTSFWNTDYPLEDRFQRIWYGTLWLLCTWAIWDFLGICYLRFEIDLRSVIFAVSWGWKISLILFLACSLLLPYLRLNRYLVKFVKTATTYNEVGRKLCVVWCNCRLNKFFPFSYLWLSETKLTS